MRNLLSANFVRLWRSKFFWTGTIFLIIMSMYMQIKNYQESLQGNSTSLDTGFFAYVLFVSILLSAFCALFTGTEYSDGTMRNKIIIGHKRSRIYLSNLLTCIAVSFIMCLLSMLTALCVGVPLLGFFRSSVNDIVVLTVSAFVLMTALGALFICIVMLCQSKATSAVACLLLIFTMLFAGAFINAKLDEPEYQQNYTLSNSQGVIENEMTKNPNYVEGTSRKIYEFLYDFLPGGQIIQLSGMNASNPNMLSLYSGLITVISTAAGLLVFRRKDLK
ncbi:ABC transporter permease subunit [Ihubacter sp. rT4E-8]|uniref:ABC transporter permease subunit n=1 Tax=unclassified Ihubacter TaxID=2633299 RepID=UPI003C7C2500